MKAYLAGPMSGIEHHNFPAFEEAAAGLRAITGYEIVSPHELSLARLAGRGYSLEDPEVHEYLGAIPWEEHLRQDLAEMLSCEAVFVLPGWEDSRGARLEVGTAFSVGLRVFDLHGKELVNHLTESVYQPPEASASDVVVDPVTGAMKADARKPRPDLMPVWPLMETARVLEFGATKYSPNNWRAGFDWSRVYGAALRHLYAFWGGEDLDPETGLSHVAHALCCIMFLAEFTHSGAGKDDRWRD